MICIVNLPRGFKWVLLDPEKMLKRPQINPSRILFSHRYLNSRRNKNTLSDPKTKVGSFHNVFIKHKLRFECVVQTVKCLVVIRNLKERRYYANMELRLAEIFKIFLVNLKSPNFWVITLNYINVSNVSVMIEGVIDETCSKRSNYVSEQITTYYVHSTKMIVNVT